jgi:hypothetical protein
MRLSHTPVLRDKLQICAPESWTRCGHLPAKSLRKHTRNQPAQSQRKHRAPFSEFFIKTNPHRHIVLFTAKLPTLRFCGVTDFLQRFLVRIFSLSVNSMGGAVVLLN